MCKKVGTCFQFWIVAGVQANDLGAFFFGHASCVVWEEQEQVTQSKYYTEEIGQLLIVRTQVMIAPRSPIIGLISVPCKPTGDKNLRANITSEDKGELLLSSTIYRYLHAKCIPKKKLPMYELSSWPDGWYWREKRKGKQAYFCFSAQRKPHHERLPRFGMCFGIQFSPISDILEQKIGNPFGLSIRNKHYAYSHELPYADSLWASETRRTLELDHDSLNTSLNSAVNCMPVR